MAAVVASLVDHPSLQQVLLPSLDGHRRHVQCAPGWGGDARDFCCRAACWCLLPWGWGGGGHGAATPAHPLPFFSFFSFSLFPPVYSLIPHYQTPPNHPTPPNPIRPCSQLYIAALNVLIGIARAPYLDVRALLRARITCLLLAALCCWRRGGEGAPVSQCILPGNAHCCFPPPGSSRRQPGCAACCAPLSMPHAPFPPVTCRSALSPTTASATSGWTGCGSWRRRRGRNAEAACMLGAAKQGTGKPTASWAGQ